MSNGLAFSGNTVERLSLAIQRSELWQRFQHHRARIRAKSKIHSLDGKIVVRKGEIRLFAIMRNESLRLPYFIEYYRMLGVDRFFFIDNDSTDDSIAVLHNLENVHVFSTKEPYRSHWLWMENLLKEYGSDCWCMVVDIDELFSFPGDGSGKLRVLCNFLDANGDTAVRALLLDMYFDGPLMNAHCIAGQNPLEVLTYFDPHFYEIETTCFDRRGWKHFQAPQFAGGVRDRILGERKHFTNLNKFPLFRFTSNTYLMQGMHAINGARIADLRGVVFHTKFLSDCIEEAKQESVREQHFDNASYYKVFRDRTDMDPQLSLFSKSSIRLVGTGQLLELGMMQTTESYSAFCQMMC